MNLTRTAAPVLLLGLALSMGACSSDESDPKPSASASASVTEDAPAPGEPGSGVGAESTGDIKGSCEEFNSIMEEMRATSPDDADAFDDLYVRSEEAKKTSPEETYGLFSATSLLALDKALGETNQETSDALRDATFAASGPCTAEDVTLLL